MRFYRISLDNKVMVLRYVNPSRRLNPVLEQLVSKHFLPDELIFGWHGVDNDRLLRVLLIDEEIHREHKAFSEIMGGLCAGGGRTLSFRQVNAEWEFVEEGSWIS